MRKKKELSFSDLVLFKLENPKTRVFFNIKKERKK